MATSSIIYVDNHSTCVTDTDVQLIVSACNILLPSLSRAWGLQTYKLRFLTKPHTSETQLSEWIFHIIDSDIAVPDALAYHTQTDGTVEGYVLAETILKHGGVVLYKDPSTSTVASALFHEVAETILDPFCNTWWQATDRLMMCAEMCDPVQSNIILVHTPDPTHPSAKIPVGLSDFVYPAWSDPQATGAKGLGKRFNHANTLKAPFTIAMGGYVITLDLRSGDMNYVFGKSMPEWLIDIKKKSIRNARRCGIYTYHPLPKDSSGGGRGMIREPGIPELVGTSNITLYKIC